MLCKNAKSQKNNSHDLWTPQEDIFLRSNVPQKGQVNQKEIQRLFNQEMTNRPKTTRQLRERYTNHSKFQNALEITRSWSLEETEAFFKLYAQYGARWSKISTLMNNRSQNSLKNKFYGSIRKLLKKINDESRKHNPAFTKPLKYDALVRVLEIQRTNFVLSSILLQTVSELKVQLISYCQKDLNQQNNIGLLKFIQKIHNFNIETRCYRINKKKSSTRTRTKQNLVRVYPETLSAFSEAEEEKSKNVSQEGSSKLNQILEKVEPAHFIKCVEQIGYKQVTASPWGGQNVDFILTIVPFMSDDEERALRELIRCVGI